MSNRLPAFFAALSKPPSGQQQQFQSEALSRFQQEEEEQYQQQQQQYEDNDDDDVNDKGGEWEEMVIPAESLKRPRTIGYSSIPREQLESLSTYDKNERATESKEKRVSVLDARLNRSRDKVQSTMDLPFDMATATVDSSLLVDDVGTTARDYENHLTYKGSHREDIAEEDFDEDDDDDHDQGADDMEVDNDPIYPDDDIIIEEGDDDAISLPRVLFAPGMRVPDTASHKEVNTFEEYVGPNKATKQFETNMRNLRGPEQSMFVAVRNDDAIYEKVGDTLNSPLAYQQITRYSIARGMSLPDPPVVSKVMIQDGLTSPNPEIGERACVYASNGQCESYKMSVARKKKYPKKYEGVEPFACKEFYFGRQGEAIRAAIANGTPLSEVQNAWPVMCVMCQLAIVTKTYKQYALGLVLTPPHVLHSFQVQYNVPGEYPYMCMLMGDTKYMGIIAPYLKWCKDNYEWEPVAPVVSVEGYDPVSRAPQLKRKQSIQKWTELPCLDFQ